MLAEVVTCLGSLVQWCCGDGGALQTNVTGRCGEHWVCPTRGCVFSLLHCSGSRLLYIERALHCVRFQFSGTPQKRGLGWPCVLCLPGPSSSGCQELDGRTLPGCGVPHHPAVPASVSMRAGRVRVPCVCSEELASSCDPPSGCRPSRISGSLWLEAGSLFAVW